MKVVCIIQARMGSSRLPGKVLKKIVDKSVLEHDIYRLRKAKNIDEIVIATTIENRDNAIVEEAKNLGVRYYRGSELDVLERYYYAAKETQAHIVVRVTSDCPCIDPILIDEIINKFKIEFLEGNLDYINNTLELSFPRGYDVEVFSFKVLEIAYNNAKEKFEREHVTPYIYCNKDKFKVQVYKSDVDYSNIRVTLDTEEDLNVITKVYEKLYKENKCFGLQDVINLYNSNPKIFAINQKIIQKKFSE
ncbi:glycosyltransferase family protein [Oceanirhabdus sp. W0125-5]|uniref:glycosyltransferase family protein n=1 Tax=Oceanirhabdus sp. W0125-5 TaxID=2999116 RepID=UPI0022F2DD45|nr:glycosyltransferase family protein [Oceanirhabdus sp. W0125-5]WBW96223.1 glycosyltransferase family protein [Oceanirhabdus sp. W0125-5]